MLIIADENIPNVRQAFSPLGELRTVAGRGIVPETIRDAEVLLVRSVTRIDRALLKGSRVRFLATA
ncbi:erythronate-4-phosphate dehydrogenase, partial [Candidatus Sumerlaeota bacterium]|nr:erythronate-4-phosphate dehydrogenase [Candidatus Sumerlaeota bacterium]